MRCKEDSETNKAEFENFLSRKSQYSLIMVVSFVSLILISASIVPAVAVSNGDIPDDISALVHSASATVTPGLVPCGELTKEFVLNITNHGPGIVNEIRLYNGSYANVPNTPPNEEHMCGPAPAGWTPLNHPGGAPWCGYFTGNPAAYMNPGQSLILNFTVKFNTTPLLNESNFTWVFETRDTFVGSNASVVATQVPVLLDCSIPNTTKVYLGPYKNVNGTEWISNQTLVNLSATEIIIPPTVTPSGINATYWRNTLVDDTYCDGINESKQDFLSCDNATGEGPWNTYIGPFNKPQQSCHLIEFFSTDNAGNNETIKRQCPFVDTTAPNGTKIIGDPHAIINNTIFVTNTTPITLNCVDQLPHPVGQEILYWRFSNMTNGKCTVGPWFSSTELPQLVLFPEDSLHDLEFYCADHLNNTGPVDIENITVEGVPPTIIKTVAGPQTGKCPPENENDKCYIMDENSTIMVNAIDPNPHPSDNVRCDWVYTVDDGQPIIGGAGVQPPFNITFPEDSNHTLNITCRDMLNNTAVDVETFLVDSTPPVTTKTYGWPFFAGDFCVSVEEKPEPCSFGVGSSCVHQQQQQICGLAHWINSSTSITLNATDEKSGVNATYWRNLLVNDAQAGEKICGFPQEFCNPDFYMQFVNNSLWNVYTGPFFKPEESCHVIEYYSIDNLGNKELKKWQCAFVDNSPPNVTKAIGEPKIAGVLNVTTVEGGECPPINKSALAAKPQAVSASSSSPLPDRSKYYKLHVDNPSEISAAVVGVCAGASQPNQCAFLNSSSLPNYARDSIIAEGGNATSLAAGCGNILILSSGDPINNGTDLSSDMGHPGCGPNPDGFPTHDCVNLTDFTPESDSLVLGMSSEWPEFFKSTFTDWMQVSAFNVTVNMSINSWNDTKTHELSQYGPNDIGTRHLAGLSNTSNASLMVADSGDSILDTALLVVPAGCFGNATNISIAVCGNDIVEPGEQCDLGAENGLPNSTCSLNCTLVQPEEENKITVVSPKNTTYNQTWVWANVTLNFNGSWCGVSLNDTPNQTLTNASAMAWYLNLSVPSEGQNDVVFSCNDTEGNMTKSEDVFFTINTTAVVPPPVQNVSLCGNGILEQPPAFPNSTEQCDLGALNGEKCSGCSENCQIVPITPNITTEEMNVTFISGKTPINITCEDVFPHPVDRINLSYRYRVSDNCKDWGNWTNWFLLPSNGSNPLLEKTIYFPEDSCHQLEYYCADGLGNSGPIQSEIDVVDSKPPIINKTIIGPVFVNKTPTCEVPDKELSASSLGEIVGGVNFSVKCASGIGVGIAYDGANLWYSCSSSTTDLYRADPLTGNVTAMYNIAGGLGALSYDATRNAIWAGWGDGSGTVRLITLDGSKNVTNSTVAFLAPESISFTLDDGLAFDATDDTIYISGDVAPTVHHYTSNGTHIGSFAKAPGSTCGNSGLALGGSLLYEGFNGCNQVIVVDKNNTATPVFNFSTKQAGDDAFRDEDLECDTNTFAGIGKHVMWSVEAYDSNFQGTAGRRAYAFEIPFGSCGVGGKPAPQCGNQTFIDGVTKIHVEAPDAQPHPVNNVTCDWSYTVRENQSAGGGNTSIIAPFDISFPEESTHDLSITCRDALNNTAEDNETFLVDKTPPYTTKHYEGPKFAGKYDLEELGLGMADWTQEQKYSGAYSAKLVLPPNTSKQDFAGVDSFFDVFVQLDTINNITYQRKVVDFDPNTTKAWSPLVILGIDADKDGNFEAMPLEWEASGFNPAYLENDSFIQCEAQSALSGNDTLFTLVDAYNTFKCYTPNSTGNGYDSAYQPLSYFQNHTVGRVSPTDNITMIKVELGGNPATQNNEAAYVDNVKLNGMIVIDEPTLWITSDTNITFDVNDAGPHKSGINATYVRVTLLGGNEPCMKQTVCQEQEGTGPFMKLDPNKPLNIGEDSCHLIEYYSVDNVNKTEKTHKQCDFVVNNAPEPVKEVGEPKSTWDGKNVNFYNISGLCWNGQNDSIDCWKVTTLTPVTLDCSAGPHPVPGANVCFKVDLDGSDATQSYCDEKNLTDGWCCGNEAGTTMHFKEESEHNLEFYCTDALNNTGPIDEEKFKVEGTSFEIDLNKKWNLISVPFVMLNDSIEDAFKDIAGTTEAVWTFDAENNQWLVFSPKAGNNDTLHELTPGWGYWVKELDDTKLLIGGSLFSPIMTPPDKNVVKGWNLIGYYGTDGLFSYDGPDGDGKAAKCALGSLVDTMKGHPRWSSLVTYWEPFNPNQWKYLDFNDSMDPGAGYWLEMDVSDIYAFSTTCGKS